MQMYIKILVDMLVAVGLYAGILIPINLVVNLPLIRYDEFNIIIIIPIITAYIYLGVPYPIKSKGVE